MNARPGLGDEVTQLRGEVEKLKAELQAEREVSEKFRSRLRSVLWDWVPKQRKDIPTDTGIICTHEDGSIKEIHGFSLGNYIGNGSFGRVHMAQNQRFGRVAIKIIELDQQLRLSDVLGLEQEIRAMKILSHPNLVRLLDLFRGRRHVCLVMNHVPGGNLYQHISENQPVPLATVQLIFAGIVQGVAAMHSRGFVHRDIKPENVLLTEECEAILADFGLCARSSPGETMKDVAGTAGFMAPELNSGQPYEPMPTDCFSVGATLVEMTFGNGCVRKLRDISPDNAAERLEELQQHIHAVRFRERMREAEIADADGAKKESMAPLADTPECLDFIGCSLATDPSLRLTASRALEHPFVTGESARPPQGGPQGPSNRANARAKKGVNRLHVGREPPSPASPTLRSLREPSSPLSPKSSSSRGNWLSPYSTRGEDTRLEPRVAPPPMPARLRGRRGSHAPSQSAGQSGLQRAASMNSLGQAEAPSTAKSSELPAITLAGSS